MNVKLLKKVKNIFNDIIINSLATILPVLILQFLILPIVAQRYDEVNYGLVLTLIGLITLFSQSFSVSLSNTRLLMNGEYVEKKIHGDFNLLLIMSMLLNIVVLTIGTYFYEENFNLYNIILILFISVTQLVRKYLLVSFRINIDYKSILISNLVLIIGYLIGFIIFLTTNQWQVIYLTGELMSLLYVLSKTKLHKEPLKKTSLFSQTSRQAGILLIASFLGTASTQIDRLLLFPLLGGKMVAVYYVSTLFGKTLSMAAAPINNVLLSYLAKMKNFKMDYFKLMLITSIGLGSVVYVVIIFISEPILRIIYPTYVDDAMELIYITTLTAMVTMISTVLNPIIMKFCKLSWQIWLNVINLTIFFVFSIYFINLFGILGFCYATLIAAVVKLILMINIYVFKNNVIE